MNEPPQEMLLSRIVDGEADAAEWDEVVARAESTPELWRDLALAQRDHAVLRRALDAAVHVADSVELPMTGSATHQTFRQPWAGRNWSGWAAAAAIALAWALYFVLGGPQRPIDQRGVIANQADLLPIATAADAFQAYLDMGRQERLVIGEVPTRVLVESRPAPSGEGYELLYMRQVRRPHAWSPHRSGCRATSGSRPWRLYGSDSRCRVSACPAVPPARQRHGPSN